MNITHNISATNTYNKMNISQNFSNKSMEKLSSGYKINRGADDAAGLSISEKMRSQIRGLNQASENAEQGVSMIQTAEGALNEDHAILHRIRELAIQAANDTNSRDDRDAIQSEVSELINEVNRIANTTEFNGMKLLDGTFSKDIVTEQCAKSGNINLDLSIGVTNEVELEFKNGITISSCEAINYSSLDTTKANYIKVYCKGGNLCTSYEFNDRNGNSQTVVDKKLGVDNNGDYYYNANGIKFNITKDSAQKLIKSNANENIDYFKLDISVVGKGSTNFNARKTFATKNDYCSDSSSYGEIKKFKLDEYSIDRQNYDSVEIIYRNGDYHKKDKLEVIFYKDGEEVIHDSIENGGNGKGVFLRQYYSNGISFDLEGTSQFESDGIIHAKIDLKDKLGTEDIQYKKRIVNDRTESLTDNYLSKSFTDPTIELKDLSKSFTINDSQKLFYPNSNITFVADNDGYQMQFKAYNGTTYTSETKVPWNEDLYGDYDYTFRASDFPESIRTELGSFNIPMKFSIARDATIDQVKTQFNTKIQLLTYPYNQVTAKLYPSTLRGINLNSYFDLKYSAVIASGKDCTNNDDEFIKGTNFDGTTYLNISADPTVNKDDAFYFTMEMKDSTGSTIHLKYKLVDVTGYGTNYADEYKDKYWYYPEYTDSFGNRYQDTSIKYQYSKKRATSYNGMVSLLSGDFDITDPGGGINLTFHLYNDEEIHVQDGSTIPAGTDLGGTTYSVSIPQGSTEADLYNIMHNLKGADIYDNGPNSSYYFYNEKNNYGSTVIDYNYDYKTITEDVTYEDVSRPIVHDTGLYFHVGANENQIIKSSFSDMRANRLGLTGQGEGYTHYYSVNNGISPENLEKGLSVTSRTDANFAISIVDKALDIVSSERSKLGSIQNRLEYTINNLDTSSENMTSSESTIRDVDMASEMMSLTKNQILQQASQAMLTQAMQKPEQVLELLR